MQYHAPVTIEDIRFNTLISTIHSAMCTGGDKCNWSFQLFKIYQEYPEPLVRQVMSTLHRYKLISIKKYLSLKNRANKFPLTNSPYNLSIKYKNTFITRHPYEIYHDSFVKLNDIQTALDTYIKEPTKSRYDVIALNSGSAAACLETHVQYGLAFDIEIPDEVILIDPKLKKQHDVSVYENICAHFKSILQCHTQDIPDDEDLEIPNEVETCSSENPSTWVPSSKTSARLPYHMLRNALNGSVDQSLITQHMHDFMVVKSSSVVLDLKLMQEKLQTLSLVYENDKKLLRDIQR